MDQVLNEASHSEEIQSRKKWRVISAFVMLAMFACWATAATLTYGIAYRGVSLYWAPLALNQVGENRVNSKTSLRIV
jgi:uncharacterized membrane protein